MPNVVTEATLLRPSLRALVEAAVLSEADTYAMEVKIVRNRADIVFLRQRDSSLVCLELKTRDWFRVSQQAKRHRAWAHRTYIAIAAAAIPDVYQAIYKTLDIGVVLANSTTAYVAKRSPRRKPASDYLAKSIRAYVRESGKYVSDIL